MKRILFIAIATVLVSMVFTGCPSKQTTNSSSNKNTEATVSPSDSGTVLNDGSTFMEKVIGALGEAFAEERKI